LGAAGIGAGRTCVLYDSPEGQNAAMLAWILEYLGQPEVFLMARFFEEWKAASHDVRYRPVDAEKRSLTVKLDLSRRILADEARAARSFKFVDFRSPEEFRGERVIGDDQPGHISGAINVAWKDIADLPHGPLKSIEAIRTILSSSGIARGDQVVCYCRSGPRAALGYLALREAGYAARLFDGSWAEWSRLGLPAETQEDASRVDK
jgi:thiosulfate/3-mercaptopyruvate sulfurtransferase